MTDTRGRINPCVPPPRKRRPFRPSALALEAICPVSGLAVAMPPTAGPGTGPGGATTGRLDRPTRLDPMVSPPATPSSAVPRPIHRAGGRGFGATVAATSPVAMPGVPQSHPVATVEIARYGNAITLDSANVRPARPASGPAGNSVAGGGGGVGAPTPAATQPPSTPPTSTPTSPSVVVPTSMGTSSTLSTGIRPMTREASKAPTSALVATGQSSAAPQQLSGSTPGSSSQSASTSTPPPPPTLYITGGYGKQTNDPPTTPIPDVMQGSEWFGQPILQGPSANSYTILKYTWTFPGGAVKGYGTFGVQTTAGVSWYVFTGDPTNAENTTVQTMGFTADDLTNDSTPGVSDPDYTNLFYFGPTSTGNQTITCTATIQDNTTMATSSLTDSATVNVVIPVGSIALDPTQNSKLAGGFFPAFGTTGVDPSGTELQFDAKYNSGASSPHGIDWMSSVNTTASGVSVAGQFDVVQTMNYSATRIYKDFYGTLVTQRAGLLADGSPPGTVLDTSFGYHGATPVGTLIRSNDSPGAALFPATYFTTPDSLNRVDSFTLTLIFKPSGGIWVPLGQLPWSWSGTAVYAAGAWTLQSGTQSVGSYSTSTTFPSWTHNVTEVLGKYQ